MTHEETVKYLKSSGFPTKVSNWAEVRLKDYKEKYPNNIVNDDEDFMVGYCMGMGDAIKSLLTDNEME